MKKLTKTQTNGFRKNNGITQDGGSVRHRIVVRPYVEIYGFTNTPDTIRDRGHVMRGQFEVS